MTGIPANVQSYLAQSRTGQPKVQAPGTKEDFGKVLDRQKTGTLKEDKVNAPNTSKPQQAKTASEGSKASSREQTDASQDVKNDGAAETDGGKVSNDTGQAEQAQAGQTKEAAAEQGPVSGKQQTEAVPGEELSGEALEQIMEVLQSAILQIQQLLTGQLNITPEELQQLMQEKGFTQLDLLQPETVNQLILDATDSEDFVALVTDENLYQSQQVITQGFREITAKADAELKEQGGLAKVLESLENPGTVQNIPVLEEDGGSEGLRQEVGQERQGRQDHGGDHKPEQNPTGQVFFQNYTAQAQNQAVAAATVSTAGMGGAAYAELPDSQQVMNQILDYMKISMRPEDTVLDMQLHPESLGTLHIQITAREGVMTAHFTASSEAVKTVLENQMVMLRENFEQQDIKVDAIEVTVETHQFESNLEQGRQRGEEGEGQGRRSRRRRVELGGADPDEEQGGAEQLAAERMAVNGSSVEYLA